MNYPTPEEYQEMLMDEKRMETLELEATRLEELRRSNCPLHWDCHNTAGCPYKKQNLCDYPHIGSVVSPATKGKK